MLRTLKTEKADKALRAAAYVLMAVCAGAFLLTEVRFGFKARILDVLPYPIWLVSLCWLVRGDLRRPVYWLGLAFIAWFGVTRLILKDTQGGLFLLELSIIYAFGLPFARATGDARRLRFFDGLAAAFVLVMTAASLVGLWAFVSGRALTLADGRYLTGVDEDIRLEILGVNPNTCGLLMAMAILLALYLLMRRYTPRRLIPALAAILPNFLALAATESRMSRLSLIGALIPVAAVIASAALKRSFRSRRAAIAAIAIAAALLCFAGLGLCANILNAPNAAVIAEVEDTQAENTETETDSAEAAQEQETTLDDYTSGRTSIYYYMFLYLQEHPAVLLRGADNYAIRAMTAYGSDIMYYHVKLHLHNSFFQAMAATGLPGLALILAICVLLLKSSLRLLFSPGRSTAEKLLPAMLLVLILDSAGESPLFVPYDQFSNAFFDLFFFLCAGYVTELGSRDSDA